MTRLQQTTRESRRGRFSLSPQSYLENAKSDLKNVMAGYHVLDGQQPDFNLNPKGQQDRHDNAQIQGRGAPVELQDLHALPQANGTFGATDVLLDQYTKAYHNSLITDPNTAIPIPAANYRMMDLRAAADNTELGDHQQLAEIHRQLRLYYSGKDNDGQVVGQATKDAYKTADKKFERILEYKVMQFRQKFESENPLVIDAGDNTQTIEKKVQDRNNLFQQQVAQYKNALFREIGDRQTNQARINANEGTPRLSFKSDAIENTANYTNDVFKTAARYEGQFRAQKAEANALANEAAGFLNRTSPEVAKGKLNDEIVTLEEELQKKVFEKVPEGEQRQAVEWKVKQMRLEAKAHRQPTAKNQQALAEHNRKPGQALYERHESDVEKYLQPARPILNKITGVEQQQETLEERTIAYEVAKNELEAENLRKAIIDRKFEDLRPDPAYNGVSDDQLREQISNLPEIQRINDEITRRVNGQDPIANPNVDTETTIAQIAEREKFVNQYKDPNHGIHQLREKILKSSPDRVNQLARETNEELRRRHGAGPYTRAQHDAARQVAFNQIMAPFDREIATRVRGGPTTAQDPAIEADIQQIVELQKGINQGKLPIADQATYKLAKANIAYQGQMSKLSQELEANQNAHPDILKSIQDEMQGARIQHKNEIMGIHEEAGSHGLLKQFSKLMGIHEEAGSDELLKQISGPLDAIRNAPRSPLSPSSVAHPPQKSARLPVLKTSKYKLNKTYEKLTEIENRTIKVNNELGKLEKQERELEADPELAKSESFKQSVQENYQALQKEMNELTKLVNQNSAYLKAHPDVAEFAQKASRLQDKVNRDNLLQRSKLANLAADAVGGKLSRTLPGQVLGAIGRQAFGENGFVQGIDSNMQYNEHAGEKLENTTVATKYYVQDDMFKWRLVDLKATVKRKDANGEEQDVTEDVVFSEAKLMELYEKFCEQHNIRGNLNKSGDTIEITWPRSARSTENKDKWLEYLKKAYQEEVKKEEAEATPPREAGVHMDHPTEVNEDRTISGVPGGSP